MVQHTSPVRLSLLLLLLYISVSSAQISWSTLTATQLGALPVSAFSNITIAELASIPTNAISGFTNNQISSITPSAAPGFTADQTSQFTGSSFSTGVCGSLTAVFMGNMTASAFSGFNSGCAGNFQTTQVSQWSAAQVAAIPPSSIYNMVVSTIAAIPVSAFSGLTSDQVAQFKTTYNSVCAAISSAQIASLSPSTFSGFTPACAGTFTSTSLLNITPDQLSNFTTSAIEVFNTAIVSGIAPTASVGWTTLGLASVSSSGYNPGCSGFTASQVSYIPAAVFSAWMPNCINVLADKAFSSISAAQLAQLTAYAAGGFKTNVVKYLSPESGAGWTATNLAGVSNGGYNPGCGGFAPLHVSYITPAAFAGWMPDCINVLPDNVFSQVNASQIAQLTGVAAGGLKTNVVKYMAAPAAAGWTANTLSSVSSSGYNPGCSGFTQEQVSYMTPAAFTGWVSQCISLLPDYAFSLVNADQINQLTADAAGGLKTNVVKYMASAAGAGWTVTNLAGVSTSGYNPGCSGFAPAHVATMLPATFAGWVSSCVSLLPDNAWSNVSAAQISYLDPYAAGGLKTGLVHNLPASAGAGWTIANLEGVSVSGYNPGCAGFNASHVAQMLPSTFAGWNHFCVSLLPSTAFSMVSAAQFGNLSLDGADGIRTGLMANLPASAAASINSSLLYALSFGYDSACNGMTSAQFQQIPLTSYSGWNGNCVQYLTSSIFASITSQQISSIPIVAYPYFQASQISVLPDSVLTSIPLSSLKYFSNTGVDGLSAHQFTLLIQNNNASQIVELWDYTHLYSYAFTNMTNLLQVKSTLIPQFDYVYTTVGTNLTWLQLLFTTPGVISVDTLKTYTIATTWGITAATAKLMPIDTIQLLAQYTQYIVPDTMSGFDCDQLKEFVKYDDDMYSATWEVFQKNYTPCKGSSSLTSTGTGSSTQYTNTISNSISSITIGSSSSSLNTVTGHSSSSSGHSKPSPLGTGAIIGIAVGGGVVVIGVAIGAFIVLRRRRAEYAPLLP